MLQTVAKRRATEMFVFRDGDACVGMDYAVSIDGITFVLFLAVDKRVRSRGYGSRILQKLKDEFPDKKTGLNIEIPDGKSANNEQRIKRKNFYLKNGFTECDFTMKERGVLFETLSSGGLFTREEFQNLMKNYFGPRVYRKYYEFPEN